MIALLYLVFLHLTSVESGCGTQDDSIPQLTVTVATGSNSGSDSKWIYARVLYGKSLPQAQWNSWSRLYELGCNNLYKGSTNYFNLDVGGSTDQWFAVAFFAENTNDALLIESISYWDGSGTPSKVDRFCGLIAGPSQGADCFEDSVSGDSLCDNILTQDPSYGQFWLHAPKCDAVSISLSSNNGKREAGTEFYISDPGTPHDEDLSSSQLNKDGMVSILSAYSDTISANLMQFMIVVSIAVISFMCGYYYFKQRYRDSTYKSISDDMI